MTVIQVWTDMRMINDDMQNIYLWVNGPFKIYFNSLQPLHWIIIQMAKQITVPRTELTVNSSIKPLLHIIVFISYVLGLMQMFAIMNILCIFVLFTSSKMLTTLRCHCLFCMFWEVYSDMRLICSVISIIFRWGKVRSDISTLGLLWWTVMWLLKKTQ